MPPKKKKRRKDRVVEHFRGTGITRYDEKGIAQGTHSVSDKSDSDNQIITSRKNTEIPNPFNKKKPILRIRKRKAYAQKVGTTDRSAKKGTRIELFGKKVYDKTKDQTGKKADKTKRKIEKEGMRLYKRKKKQNPRWEFYKK